MTPFRSKTASTAASTVLGLLSIVLSLEGCGGASDSRPASWPYISAAIVAPNCATVSCHSRAAAVSGLDFSSADRGYTSLTGLWVWIVDPTGTAANGCRNVGNAVVCQREHRSLVVPFDPAQSRLVQMLRANGAARMPPDRPLAEGDIRLIEKWILNGAVASGSTPAITTDAATDAGATDQSDLSDAVGETGAADQTDQTDADAASVGDANTQVDAGTSG